MEAQVEINAQVVSFSLRDASDSIVYYDIAVTHVPLARRWQVQKRFKEFDNLRVELSQIFSDLPTLPVKSLWRRLDASFLTQRKTLLDVFIRVLVKRPEITRGLQFRDFLEVAKYAPEAVPPSLQPITQSHTDIVLSRASASDGCVVALSRPDSSFRLLGSSAPYACHFLTRPSPDLPYAMLWSQSLPHPPTALCWDPQLTLLAIGFETGLIAVYRVYTELDCTKYDVFARMQAHADAVRGLALNYTDSHLFSAGDDLRFLVTDMTTEALLVEVSLESQPKSLSFVVDTARVYIATSRELLIFSSQLAAVTARIATKTRTAMTVIGVLPAVSRVFAGTSTGLVLTFRLGMLDCEQTSHEEAAFKWRGKITDIACVPQRNEVYAGNDEGLVGVWDAGRLEMITAVRVDNSGVAAVLWSQERLVVIGTGDKSIRDFEVPTNWRTQVCREKEAETALAETWKVTEDDLSGWDR